jgi:hypothetical protein
MKRTLSMILMVWAVALLMLVALPALAQDSTPATVTAEELQDANAATLDKVLLWGGGIVAALVLFGGYALRQLAQQGNEHAKQLLEIGNRLADTIPVEKVGEMAQKFAAAFQEVSAKTTNPVDDVISAMLAAGIKFVLPERTSTAQATVDLPVTRNPDGSYNVDVQQGLNDAASKFQASGNLTSDLAKLRSIQTDPNNGD